MTDLKRKFADAVRTDAERRRQPWSAYRNIIKTLAESATLTVDDFEVLEAGKTTWVPFSDSKDDIVDSIALTKTGTELTLRPLIGQNEDDPRYDLKLHLEAEAKTADAWSVKWSLASGQSGVASLTATHGTYGHLADEVVKAWLKTIETRPNQGHA
ncbi:MAG: hypothetical protein ACHREM_13765 [Polyangiales bacterium]